MTSAPDITEVRYERERDAGAYLCACPGPHTRDRQLPAQCIRCWRRIHRRFDLELKAQRIRDYWQT